MKSLRNGNLNSSAEAFDPDIEDPKTNSQVSETKVILRRHISFLLYQFCLFKESGSPPVAVLSNRLKFPLHESLFSGVGGSSWEQVFLPSNVRKILIREIL